MKSPLTTERFASPTPDIPVGPVVPPNPAAPVGPIAPVGPVDPGEEEELTALDVKESAVLA